MSTAKRKTAAFRLFHYRYEMRIPQMFMYGPNYIEKHGYHVSGDAALDRLRLSTPNVVKQTPAALAVLHADGCPIDLVNPRDAVPIYEDIQEHLTDWARLAAQGIHPADAPPLEEFRQLEAVAMELYRSAKHYEPKETRGDLLRDRLMDMNRRRNPARTESYLRSKITDSKGNLKPYVSIVDRIEKALVGSAKLWQ